MTVATQGFKVIDRETLKQKIDSKQKFHFWNAVTKEYYRNKNIAGSQWVPANELTQKLPGLGAAKGDEIVVYCSSFTCPASKQAAQILTGAGYTNVSVYEAGIADWEEAGYSITAG